MSDPHAESNKSVGLLPLFTIVFTIVLLVGLFYAGGVAFEYVEKIKPFGVRMAAIVGAILVAGFALIFISQLFTRCVVKPLAEHGEQQRLEMVERNRKQIAERKSKQA